jgi:RimJ/RimL family protein N-acetyltransferase
MKKIIIETERLLLRPIEIKDANNLFSYRVDAIVNKFQGWIPKKIEDAFEFINKTTSKFDVVDSWFQLVIIAKNSNQIIGDIGIHFIDKQQVELGITVAKNWQGKGFATEALKGIISYLFKTFNKHRITASIDPENKKSITLFERLGFRKEAHFKESLLINGAWKDDVIFAILKKEWN